MFKNRNIVSNIGKRDDTLLALGDKLARIKLQVALDNNNDDRKTKNIFNARPLHERALLAQQFN